MGCFSGPIRNRLMDEFMIDFINAAMDFDIYPIEIAVVRVSQIHEKSPLIISSLPGHSIEQVRGHELFLSDPKPVINYNGFFGKC